MKKTILNKKYIKFRKNGRLFEKTGNNPPPVLEQIHQFLKCLKSQFNQKIKPKYSHFLPQTPKATV